jgi:hypothetical protein
MDIVFRAGVSGPGVHGNWQYSEGEADAAKTFDAVWNVWDERGEPSINAAGFYFNISLRYLRIN